jgi:hypothetical protein
MQTRNMNSAQSSYRNPVQLKNDGRLTLAQTNFKLGEVKKHVLK